MLPGHRRPGPLARTAVPLCVVVGLALTPPVKAEPTEPAPTSDPAQTSQEPGGAEDPSPSSPWSEDEDAPVGDRNDTPLTGKTLEEQIAEADRLSAKLTRDNAEIGRAVKDLKSYSSRANTLLQRQAKAREEYEQATKKADDAQKQLNGYRHRLTKGRQDLRSWASDTWTHGGGYTDTMTLVETLTHESESGGNSAGDLSYLTEERLRSVNAVRKDTETQSALTKRKDQERAKASSAKRKADRAKKRADEVLKERKSTLDTLRKQHADELREAGPVANALIGLPDEDAQGASDRLTSALEDVGQDVSDFEGAKPCSTNTATYPNGQIPPSALCPLLGAPEESLRPDAAAAFNAMSKAYQRDTGNVLCVTDSYRSYAEQVVTKQDKGMWAAAPGSSNHGLGKAVDLCGGVNSFGHPAHAWMQQNAPLYGWFHPSWAASGGSLPEPWHWEFSG